MVTPMAMPAGYMGGMQASMMGVPNGMMTTQQAGYMASMAALPQTVYGVQPAQQLQWNLTQVSSLAVPVSVPLLDPPDLLYIDKLMSKMYVFLFPGRPG